MSECEWSCTRCTLINSAEASACVCCEAERPAPRRLTLPLPAVRQVLPPPRPVTTSTDSNVFCDGCFVRPYSFAPDFIGVCRCAASASVCVCSSASAAALRRWRDAVARGEFVVDSLQISVGDDIRDDLRAHIRAIVTSEHPSVVISRHAVSDALRFRIGMHRFGGAVNTACRGACAAVPFDVVPTRGDDFIRRTQRFIDTPTIVAQTLRTLFIVAATADNSAAINRRATELWFASRGAIAADVLHDADDEQTARAVIQTAVAVVRAPFKIRKRKREFALGTNGKRFTAKRIHIAENDADADVVSSDTTTLLRQLMCIRGCSVERAHAVVQVFPTARALQQADANNIRQRLADIRCANGRRIGPKLADDIAVTMNDR